MASALDVGQGTVRDLTGVCDWCTKECDGKSEICVAISCQRCEGGMFHQACVEKFLKKFGFPMNRKTGFPCPRGRGKGSTDECKGKVEKSHPIVPKNEEKKKARMAPQVLEAMARPAKAGPAPKPPVPKAQAPKPPAQPRKAPLASTAINKLAGVSLRQSAQPPTGLGGVWGHQGAAPVLANAHLPAPPEEPPAAAADGGPRSAQVPVGLVLEEALTKAQKKNMARKKKRQAAAVMETGSEASSESADTGSVVAAGPSGFSGSEARLSPAASGAAQAFGAGGAGALMGFDGAAVVVAGNQGDVLGQQGRFITDVSHFNRLLGLYCDSDDEEGDNNEADAGQQQQEEQGLAATGACEEAAAGFVTPSVPTPHPVVVVPADAVPTPSVVPAPAAVAPAPAATEGKDGVSEQAAFDAAVAESIKQYHLEEEMRRQREVLANGFGSAAFAAFTKPVPMPSSAYNPSPGLQQAPVVAPIVVAPVVEPTPAPVRAAPDAAPPLLFAHTKQQPEVSAASYGNGWVFGGGNQGNGVLPPHIPAAYAAPTAGYGAPGCVSTIAAGHTAPEVASEDDDDLSTLLALCGVAG